MKRTVICNALIAMTLASTTLCFSSFGFAATYVWNKPTGTQTFDLAANWDDGTTGFPNAIDDIAEMSTLDVTATQTINVNQAITLGELRTGDTTSTFRARTFNGTGSLKFQVSGGTAKLKYGFGGTMNVSSQINLPIELASNTEFILDLNSSSSRNLYLGAGALTGSGDMIINSATRGIVAIFTDTYNLSNYTGTFKYTSNGGGNMFQLAGNAGGTRDARQATLEMSVATAGGSVWVFDGVNGSSLELGALRGNGVIKPFATSGTLRTGYLPGTNDFSGSLEEVGRFGAGGLSYEKAGADSTQIFSGTNIYAGTTTVSAGTLLINGANSGGGAFSVASGATLGGTGSIGVSVATIAAGGNLAPGGASIESLDVGGAIINGTLTIAYQGVTGSNNDSIDLLNVANNLDITTATLDFANLGGTLDDSAMVFAKYGTLSGLAFGTVSNLPAGYQVDYAYDDGSSSKNIALVAIPEPGACVLSALGLGGLLAVIQRRQSKCARTG